jgi:sarcosine oxidase subunit gamma
MQRGNAFVPDHRLSAFAPFVADLAIAHPSGLRVEVLHGVHAVSTMAYRGSEEVAGAALTVFARSAPGATLLKTGPGTWLTLCEGPHPGLGDAAATFDHGNGHALLKLHGSAGMRVLQKGIFVDLETALASCGDCVCSVIAHINVIAWRAAPDIVGVAVPRSFAGSFWHWFSVAAAAEGIAVGR